MDDTDNAGTVIYSKPESKQDKFFYYNTLTGLVKSLEGEYTTIDLRNECCVTGKIAKVDGKMNVDMRDVIFYDSRGKERVFPFFFLGRRNIRYVHIPKKKSALGLIEDQLKKLKKPPNEIKKKRTLKELRSKRYQKETVQSAFADKST